MPQLPEAGVGPGGLFLLLAPSGAGPALVSLSLSLPVSCITCLDRWPGDSEAQTHRES